MKMTIFMSSDERLDIFFKSFGFESRSEFSNYIKDGNVSINGNQVKPSYKIKAGDEIYTVDRVDYNKPKDLNIPIIYEDDNILIINKPPYIATHGAKSYKGDSVVNWLLYYGCPLSNLSGEDRPGIVHRLDRNTSGALIIAKNNDVHFMLQKMFKDRNVKKEYLAITNGCADFKNKTIISPIGRSKNPTKMAISDTGREAISYLEVLDKNFNYSFIKVEIETGRTHQIRVHLQSINIPIIGDEVYGIKKEKISAKRQMLHSYHIEFIHPIKNKIMKIYANIPEDFKDVLQKTNLYERGLNSINV